MSDTDWVAEHREVAEGVAKALSKMVNNFQCDDQAFIDALMNDHRTLQSSVAGIMFKCISTWAEMYADGRFDGRNEYPLSICAEIEELMYDKYGKRWYKMPLI